MEATAHDALREELRKEANRICIDAEYTGRQHMEMGRWWRQRATWIGLPAAVIAAAASGGAALSALLGWGTALTVVLGFAGAIAGAVRAFFKPEEQAEAHAVKGAACIAIRNDARRFMNLDLASTAGLDALTDRVRILGQKYDGLRGQEPLHLAEWTYPKVKAQIEAGNYEYENDRLWQS